MCVEKNKEAYAIEKEASDRSYRCLFGVSEWESFLTVQEVDRLIELADEGYGTWAIDRVGLARHKRLRQYDKVLAIVNRISLSCLDKKFELFFEYDKKSNDRLYLQIKYSSECTKTKEQESWKGRKWYLSEYMTDDEVVKTAYCAFEAAVKHEIMEGFKVDNKVLFNPHVNFEELLKISDKEVYRS